MTFVYHQCLQIINKYTYDMITVRKQFEKKQNIFLFKLHLRCYKIWDCNTSFYISKLSYLYNINAF